MTVYITGSSGFVGKAISNWLELGGHEVARLNRDSINQYNTNARSRSHTLIHCAWTGVLGKDRNSDLQEKNIQLCEKILELADFLNIDQLIAFGSQAEYGNPNCNVDERAPLHPTTRYGEIKIACQELLREGCIKRKIPFIWLRLFDPYGPGDRPEWFLPYVIKSALLDRSPELTKCTQIWDYIYIDDVCRCVELILAQQTQLRLSGCYNLSSNQPVILRDLVNMVFDKIKPLTARPLFSCRPFRDDQVHHLQGCNKKLETNFGWLPQIMISEGLEKTINYEQSLLKHKL
jgi:nucleoside-diphosphate-sugar epimerase